METGGFGAKPPNQTNMRHYQTMPVRGGLGGEAKPTCATIKECQFRRVLCARDFANTTWALATADELDESLFAALAKPTALAKLAKFCFGEFFGEEDI